MGFFFHHLRGETKKVIIRLPLGSFRRFQLKSMNYSGIVEIGFLQTLLTLTMFLSELPSGLLTDKFGAKKIMYVGHFLICLYLFFMMLNINIAFITLGFMFYGIGLALISGSDQTLIYQYKPEQSYQKKIGKYMAISIVGLTVSSFIGGYLSTISWTSIFLIGIITQLISIVILMGIKLGYRKFDLKKREKVSFIRLLISLKSITSQKHMKYLLITISIFQSTISVLLNFSQLVLLDKNINTFNTSILISLALVCSAVSSLSIEKISIKIGQNVSTGVFLIVLAAAFFLFSSSETLLVIISFLLINFSFEFIDTSLNTVVQELSSDKIRTTLISGINTLTAGIMFVETSIISALFAKYNISVVFASVGIVLVMFTSIFYILFLKTINKKISN
ncbi:MFS transporter [Enterococcus faecalis]|uniref:MFS transporter n=4 Tax=Enterococcus faecalis TaxID=1351 RepID=UPI0030C84E2F